MSVIHVNTKIDNPNAVVANLAETIGTGAAAGVVQRWYKEYNEFVYDTDFADIVFYKKIYSGYWEAKQENLIKWK